MAGQDGEEGGGAAGQLKLTLTHIDIAAEATWSISPGWAQCGLGEARRGSGLYTTAPRTCRTVQ